MRNKTFKNLLQFFTFQPPNEKADNFVLEEQYEHKDEQTAETDDGFVLPKLIQNVELLLYLSEKMIKLHEKAAKCLQDNSFTEMASLKTELESIQKQLTTVKNEFIPYDYWQESLSSQPLSSNLEDNYTSLELAYKLPKNAGITIRRINIGSTQPIKGLLVFIEQLVDKKLIDFSIMKPLMALKNETELQIDNLTDEILKKYLPSGQAAKVAGFDEVQDAINHGKAVLLLDGSIEGIAIDVVGLEHRSIGRPVHEQSLRGAQNSFTEVLAINLGQIRSIMNTNDLVVQTMKVGTKGQKMCAVVYLESVVNPTLIKEITARIKKINNDYVGSIGMLEELIEESPYSVFPKTTSTERPDRVGFNLANGRLAILLDGSPFVLIAPITFFSLIETIDDYNGSFMYTVFLRAIRYLGLFLTIFFPALYLAVTIFHPEAVPTELLLAIASSRLEVPFPTIVEILLMEVSFELIREGGLRTPGILGSTIGIVGALILGQAAVSAKIVSPIMVIIVSVTGLASFTIAEHRLANAMGLLRFVFMLLAAFLGLISVACGMLVLLAALCNLKSFGIPYMAPVAPKVKTTLQSIIRLPYYSVKRRPDELNPKIKRDIN